MKQVDPTSESSPPLRHGDICDLSPSSSMKNMVGKPKAAVVAEIGNKYDILPTPAVAKVQKDLRSSSKDLHTAVEDPLPDALEMASGILADMATHHGETENQNKTDLDAHNASTEKGVDVTNVGATSTGDHQDGTSFPGFMTRNRTARTHEWDDDPIECSLDKSPNRSGLKLPSPKKRQVSPLNKGDPSRFLKRRKIRKWSPQEEETLRKAVKEYAIASLYWHTALCATFALVAFCPCFFSGKLYLINFWDPTGKRPLCSNHHIVGDAEASLANKSFCEATSGSSAFLIVSKHASFSYVPSTTCCLFQDYFLKHWIRRLLVHIGVSNRPFVHASSPCE
ncbi:hypothetical protein ACLOJK_003108 [Asimina triloba]